MATFDSLVSLLRTRAHEDPIPDAYEFLSDGSERGALCSYAELDRKARAIAASLRSRYEPGERALLLYPPGIDYVAAFLGCLYAGIIAVPGYPPRPNESLRRIEAIREASGAKLVLTSSLVQMLMESSGATFTGFEGLAWIATDQLDEGLAEEWRDPGVSSSDLAFLQYTSGSTGTPKGVMVSHGNLLANFAQIAATFDTTRASRSVIWLPPYHDMGLIGGILTPLFAGFPVTLMSPLDFIHRPSFWLETISRRRATHSGGPDFAYKLCVRRVSDEQLRGLDLSSWKLAFTGAEPVRDETIEQFSRKFGRAGFRRSSFCPCYGLAEATLLVTGAAVGQVPVAVTVDAAALEQNRVVETETRPDDAPNAHRRLVSSGTIVAPQQLLVVNPETRVPCEPGSVGEIWVMGPNVAGGYWGLDDVTARTFHARTSAGEGPFLRTGDLGFLRGGELFVSGRLKDLIIIRGRNHYPQDIEESVQGCHAAIRPGCGAAFAAEIAGEERLVVVQEVQRAAKGVVLDEVASAIRAIVAERHELQVERIVLIRPGALPKTSSGKIQRYACRQRFMADGPEVLLASRLEDAAPTVTASATPETDHAPEVSVDWTAVASLAPAARLATLTAYLLRAAAKALRVPGSSLAADTVLGTVGVDSLTAIELKVQIDADADVSIPFTALFGQATIAKLARTLDDALQARPQIATIASADDANAHAPPTVGQRAQWFIQRLAPASTAYTVASAVTLLGDIDEGALGRAFSQLVRRHAMLRAKISVVGGEPSLVIDENGDVDFAIDAALDDDAQSDERISEHLHRPFDLEAGPVLRVRLFRRPSGDPVLLFAVHHVAVDYWSLGVIVRELEALYRAERRGLPPPPPRPDAFLALARAEARALARGELDADLAYWRGALDGAEMQLALPTDRPRPPVQAYAGGVVHTKIDRALVDRLRALARSQGVTLYTVTLAAYQALIHRYTGQRDVLVGTPALNRRTPAAMDVVGYLTNPVVVRARFEDETRVTDLVAQVHARVVDALEHQAYPFPLLVEKVQPARDPSRSPIFQAMLTFQPRARENADAIADLALGAAGDRFRLGDLEMRVHPLDHQVAQVDLALTLVEGAHSLGLSARYNSDLFDAATVERFTRHYLGVLEAMASGPEVEIRALPILDAEERARVLEASRGTSVPFADDVPVHVLIERQVDRTPDAVALVFERQSVTYRELDARANRLAHHLRHAGVGPNVLVGLAVERSLEMVVALLAILKSGGAYLPLDPTYPRERLAFMLDDAKPEIVLTQDRWAHVLAGTTTPTLRLDADRALYETRSSARPSVDVRPTDLAYVIFTSGSTGKPKGAMNEHRAVANRLMWMRDDYGFTPSDVVVQKTPFGFDVSVWEFFLPLLVGARLVVARPEGHQDPAYLADLVRTEKATTMHFVPSMLQVFLEHEGLADLPLTRVFCSGEALSYELQERFFDALPRTELVNLYGPTEAAVDVTQWTCVRDSERRVVPLGRPVRNTSIYVLDERLEPVAPGVAGEIYIGGVQVGRGYLNRPELTADRFLRDPFDAGGHLYKTGDLGRYAPDGTLEYLGRLDFQVKVHGVRVELGEIEAAIASFPSVRECAVMARGVAGGGQRLVAYVVPRGGEAIDEAELKAYLGTKLIASVIPRAVVVLAELPLSSNGKVDRRALPEPAKAGEDRPYLAPRTPAESAIAKIWQELLGVERVGVEDKFFELGGHSLMAAKLQLRLQAELGFEVPLVELFRLPTVADIARHVTSAHAPARGTEQVRDRAAARREAVGARRRRDLA